MTSAPLDPPQPSTQTPPDRLPSGPQGRRVAPPAFRAPEPETSPQTGAQGAPTPGPMPEPVDLPDSASESLPDGPSDGPAKSPTGRGSSPGSFASKAALVTAFRAGLGGGLTLVHEAAARDELEQEAGVWLATDEEIAGIADPIAAITHRRTGALGMTEDAADLIKASMGVAVYSGRQLRLRSDLRRMRVQNAAAAGFPTPDDLAGDPS